MQLDGLKILLAEDHPTNRLVAQKMLESMGAVVVPAEDGAEALDIVHRERFDVLLIDIEMPRLSGLEVIRRLATDASAPGGPAIIALTAYAAPRQRAEIVAAGAAGVVTKPIISIEQFGQDIRRLVEAAPGAREAQIDADTYRGLAAAVGPGQLGTLLGKVDADISDAYDRALKAVSGSDMAELRAATHILVSVAGAVGATGLQGLAQELNRAAHARDEDAIAGLVPETSAEAARVRSFLCRERHGERR